MVTARSCSLLCAPCAAALKCTCACTAQVADPASLHVLPTGVAALPPRVPPEDAPQAVQGGGTALPGAGGTAVQRTARCGDQARRHGEHLPAGSAAACCICGCRSAVAADGCCCRQVRHLHHVLAGPSSLRPACNLSQALQQRGAATASLPRTCRGLCSAPGSVHPTGGHHHTQAHPGCQCHRCCGAGWQPGCRGAALRACCRQSRRAPVCICWRDHASACRQPGHQRGCQRSCFWCWAGARAGIVQGCVLAPLCCL